MYLVGSICGRGEKRGVRKKTYAKLGIIRILKRDKLPNPKSWQFASWYDIRHVIVDLVRLKFSTVVVLG